MNRKGSILDIMLVIFIIVGSVFVLFAVKKPFTDIRDQLTEPGGEFVNDTASQEILASGEGALGSFNWMIPLFLILLTVVVCIMAYMLPVNTGTFVIGIFLVLIFVVIAGMLGSSFQDFRSDADYDNATATYPAVDFVMSNFGKIIFVIGALVLVVMYVSYSRSGGGA